MRRGQSQCRQKREFIGTRERERVVSKQRTFPRASRRDNHFQSYGWNNETNKALKRARVTQWVRHWAATMHARLIWLAAFLGNLADSSRRIHCRVRACARLSRARGATVKNRLQLTASCHADCNVCKFRVRPFDKRVRDTEADVILARLK